MSDKTTGTRYNLQERRIKNNSNLTEAKEAVSKGGGRFYFKGNIKDMPWDEFTKAVLRGSSHNMADFDAMGGIKQHPAKDTSCRLGAADKVLPSRKKRHMATRQSAQTRA